MNNEGLKKGFVIVVGVAIGLIVAYSNHDSPALRLVWFTCLGLALLGLWIIRND